MLFVEGTDLRALFIAQGGQGHRTGDMIVLELGWRADIDDGVEGLPPVADAGYAHDPVTSTLKPAPVEGRARRPPISVASG